MPTITRSPGLSVSLTGDRDQPLAARPGANGDEAVLLSDACSGTREVPSAARESEATGTARTSPLVRSTLMESTTEAPTKDAGASAGMTSR